MSRYFSLFALVFFPFSALYSHGDVLHVYTGQNSPYEGNYSCKAENVHGVSQSNVVTLFHNGTSRRSYDTVDRHQTAAIGDTVLLECLSDQIDTNTSLLWSRADGQMLPWDRVHLSASRTILTLSDVDYNDAAAYECVDSKSNEVKKARRSF